jgi:CheY-like chemotaxis protein
MQDDSQDPFKFVQPPLVSLATGYRPARILICDDEPIIRELGMLILHWHFKDYVAVECANGNEAYREICRQTPDLLVTDYVHEGIGVEETLFRCYRTSSFFPIIVASGAIGAQPIRTRLTGFHIFPVLLLDKPYTLELFLARVYQALRLKVSA